jgi:transcriptional regulator with XRE-family HTH domain
MKQRTPEQRFGRMLRELRIERGMSQEMLALDADYSHSYVSLLENGKSSPTLRTLVRLADALHCKVAEFFVRMDL